MIFTVPIERELRRIDKNGEEITKYISYIIQFIDNARFIASTSSNLVNNFFEFYFKFTRVFFYLIFLMDVLVQLKKKIG